MNEVEAFDIPNQKTIFSVWPHETGLLVFVSAQQTRGSGGRYNDIDEFNTEDNDNNDDDDDDDDDIEKEGDDEDNEA